MKAKITRLCSRCQENVSATISLEMVLREESTSLKDIMQGTPVMFYCEGCRFNEEQVVSEINSRFRLYPESHGQGLFLVDEHGDSYLQEYWESSIQYKIFVASCCDVDRVLQPIKYDDISNQTLRQLCFVQIITIFEAYLSDRLKELVLKKRSPFLRELLVSDKAIGDKKVSILEVLDTPDLVYKQVTKYLSSIVYHNISRANYLYGNVVGVEFEYKNKIDRETLYKAIEKRHDFVHRNGFNNNGFKIECDRAYISKVLHIVIGVVTRLEHEVKKKLKIIIEMENRIPF